MTAQEVFDLGMKRLQTFTVAGLMPALRAANEGAIEDVLNTNGSAYYQWSACLVDALKPKQVVELGGAMGVWDICVLHTLSQDSRLYSVTIPEHGLEFSYVVDTYQNFVPCMGNDLDLAVWPKELDLSKTDVWFIDSEHTEKHLRAELELYKPFFKKGAILLFDDIHEPELWKVWQELQWNKHDSSDPLHWSGYGICVV